VHLPFLLCNLGPSTANGIEGGFRKKLMQSRAGGGGGCTTPQYFERSSRRELEMDRVRVVLGVDALQLNSSSRGLNIGERERPSLSPPMGSGADAISK